MRWWKLLLLLLILTPVMAGAGLGLATIGYGWMSPWRTPNMLLTMASGTPVRQKTVSLETVSPHLIHAVIAAEDARFCQHGGIDWDALQQALDGHRAGKRRRGASTISQQTAKNLFLWNGGGWTRKAVEAPIALWIDLIWPKSRVMEHYLNIAEWGDGIYGAEAAAQARFGVSAKELTREQAALLASVLPNPATWRVDPPGPYVRQRAATIRARMGVVAREGYAACVTGPA